MVRNRVHRNAPLAALALCCFATPVLAAISFDAPFRSLVTGKLPYGIAIGDVDGDGRPDLVTADEANADPYGTISVHLSLGGTSYAPRITQQAQYRTSCVYLGDLDGDGRLDAVVGSPGYVGVMKGHGDGTFAPVVDYPTAASGTPRRGVLCDLDEDGKLDVLMSNSSGPSMSFLRGNGDGTLQPSVSIPITTSFFHIARVNNDAHWDVVSVVDYGTIVGEQVSVRLGNGDGTFGSEVLSNLGTDYPYSFFNFELADLNADGRADLCIGYSSSGLGNFFGVSLGNGDGTFTHAALQPSGAALLSARIASGDFDGDGKVDVVLANNPNSTGGTLSLFRGHGDGTFDPYRKQAGNHGNDIAVADLDLDGDLDFAMPSRIGFSIGVFHNNGDMTFGRERSTPIQGNPQGLAIGDLDLDGHPDALGFSSGTPTTRWTAISQGTTFAPPSYDTYSPITNSVALGALDADANLDLITAVEDSIRIHIGLGGGDFGPPSAFAVGPRLVGPQLVDLDHDGALDLVVGSNSASTLWVLMGQGDGSFDAPSPLTLPSPGGAAIVRIDADTYADLATRSSGVISLFRNRGDGTFDPRIDVPTTSTAGGFGDLNGDGLTDLVTTGPSNSEWSQVLLGNGDGSFTALPSQHIGLVGLNAYPAYIQDLDGDGRADVAFWAGFAQALHIGRGNGDGTFETPGMGWGMGASPDSPQFADLNGDGLPEVLSVNSYGFDLAVLKNTSTPTTGVGDEPHPGAIRAPIELRGFAPNPARGAPIVVFTAARRGAARLEIHDLAGRLVHERDLGVLEPGTHRICWSEGARATPGAYWVRVVQDGQAVTRKGVVLR